ncbi:hypothetical protein HPP92_028093 [Vanilla planifolia]|uniref:Uncharacterized protein n=1 Tax=Vanilla planifolia TaxID=51239 RepID=A0A835U3Z4_VANPL|nr:hypothetical protein HPP92_028093 [Vanilla planifolia]
MMSCNVNSKEAAGMKTAKLKDEKEVLDRQLHAADEACKNLNENHQELLNREQELSSQEDQLTAKLKKANEAINKLNEEISRASKELKEIQQSTHSARGKYQSLKQKVDECDQKLRELKADKHESEQMHNCLRLCRVLSAFCWGSWSDDRIVQAFTEEI